MTTQALSIDVEKHDLRREMRGRRDAIAPAERARAAADATAALLAMPELHGVQLCGLYMAMRSELATAALFAALRARGVGVALPRVIEPHHRSLLRFHRVDDAAELQPGTMGILEPAASAPEVLPHAIQMFVVPGLAFDARGARLGWGRGHYDATLAAAPSALRLGWAYQQQVLPVVPERPGDERMDFIITDAGARATGARPLPWRVR